MATQFASSLRRHIFKLHLGLLPPQPCTHESKVGNAARPLGVPQESSPETDHLVEDPVAPEFWQLWRGTARKNLQHFQNVFHCVPSSEVHTWEDYDRYVPKPPTLVGHVHDPEMSLDYVRAELDGIKGEFLNSSTSGKACLTFFIR